MQRIFQQQNRHTKGLCGLKWGLINYLLNQQTVFLYQITKTLVKNRTGKSFKNHLRSRLWARLSANGKARQNPKANQKMR